MAEVNPCWVLHNAGATHTAELARMLVSGLLSGVRAASSMMARGGVNPAIGGGLVVTAQGSPSLTLDIASGICFVPGSEDADQGVYVCYNSATDTVTLDAAHGSLPRIDLVIAKVQDSVYSGAVDSWTLDKVTGTAAGSPAAPALPNNAILLATVNRTAADDTVASGDIVDSRPLIAAAGGAIPGPTTAMTALLSLVNEGQLFYDKTVGALLAKQAGAWAPLTHTSAINSQNFTAGGTWTKPNGARTCLIMVQGGGGAGGGAPATAASQTSAGAGGQGGSYAESVLEASALASTVAVTIGAGGTGVSGTTGNAGATSSFGAHVSAAGGAGGPSAGASGVTGAVQGGTGAQSMTGTRQIGGGGGGAGFRLGTTGCVGGHGGNSFLGNGGAATGNGTTAAATGEGYGGGGGGASNNASTSAKTGGAGTAGIVVVLTWR